MEKYKPWQIWGEQPEIEETLALRAAGELPEMESTKQLAKLISEIYKPGMRVLDVGCNAGHYLRGLRRIDKNLNYVGVDAYEVYIEKAKKIYAHDAHAKFDVRDIMQPLLKENPFDIVYSCNLIIHLPFYKIPVKNLIDSTKQYCFIRTLLSDCTTIVKRVHDPIFDESDEPLNFVYQNTYNEKDFIDYIRSLGCNAEIIKDEYNASLLAGEHEQLKKKSGTRIVGGLQADGNIIFNWKFVKITKSK